MNRYLDNGVEQDDSRLLSDDLFGREVMLDELRDGGEAGPFKSILTLPERERWAVSAPLLVGQRYCTSQHTYISVLDDEVAPLLIRKHRQDVLPRFTVTLPHQEVSLLS